MAEALPNVPEESPEGPAMHIELSAYARGIHKALSDYVPFLHGPDETFTKHVWVAIDHNLDLLNEYRREHPYG